MTAACLLRLRDHADLAAMGRYEPVRRARRGPLDGWRDQPHAVEISAGEFERRWTEARRALG